MLRAFDEFGKGRQRGSRFTRARRVSIQQDARIALDDERVVRPWRHHTPAARGRVTPVDKR